MNNSQEVHLQAIKQELLSMETLFKELKVFSSLWLALHSFTTVSGT